MIGHRAFEVGGFINFNRTNDHKIKFYKHSPKVHVAAFLETVEILQTCTSRKVELEAATALGLKALNSCLRSTCLD